MKVDEIVDNCLKSKQAEYEVIDETRSQLSLYNSLRKYIARHNLRMSVRLTGGKIKLIMNEKIRRIRQFVLGEWDREYAYETTDISKVLQCDNRVSRYYLMKMVNEGLLKQLKYHGHTWYIHTDQATVFKQYKYIGVKIL